MTIGRFCGWVSLGVVAAALAGCGGAAAGGGGADSPSGGGDDDSSGGGKGGKGGLVGQPAPSFSVPVVANGKGTVSLDDLKGKVVLVDFWGTFCDPCKKSFPKLQALYSKYQGDGLRIVGISEDEEDDKGKIPGFADSYGAKFTLALDADKGIAHQYKPPTMPSSFLIDKNGVVRYAHVGYHDGEEAEVEKEIKELLGK